jgi:hypothetical protein
LPMGVSHSRIAMRRGEEAEVDIVYASMKDAERSRAFLRRGLYSCRETLECVRRNV